MTRRNWRTVNPRSLREAIELCKDYALEKHRLQSTLNSAVSALLGFASGSMDADQVSSEINTALEALAWHRENVARSHQPELELNNHE